MNIIWIALPLAILNISYSYKIPGAELRASNNKEKDLLQREESLISTSLPVILFQWISEPPSSNRTVLNLKPSKVLRVKRDAADDNTSLDELTNDENLEEEITTEAVTNNTEVPSGNILTTPELTHQPAISTNQTEPIQETTPEIVTVHAAPSSTNHDPTTSSMAISETVNETASAQTSVPTLVTDHPLTIATEYNTTTSFRNLIDPEIGPSITQTSVPVETIASSVSTLNHTDVLESTHAPDNPDVTNRDNTQPEKQNIMHTLMGQCLLAISILAFIATVFIISTIVLAAKLSNLKSRYRLLNKNSTEMVCISSLLPDNEQVNGKSKVRANKLKTFAANVEDSDGDNLTLNSFLPDH
ncbi:P-selectin glycoprotein ligand 1 [Lissotriton helveticus]